MNTRAIAESAVQALATNALTRYTRVYEADHLTWRDFADQAREDLATLAEAGVLNHYVAAEFAKVTA